MACSDSDFDCDTEEFTLTGKWKLVEFCMSPGDASCPVQYPDYEQIFEFGADSTFSFRGESIQCEGNYSIDGNWILLESNDEQNCINQRYYLNPIDACSLNINPPCIEACISLYERI